MVELLLQSPSGSPDTSGPVGKWNILSSYLQHSGKSHRAAYNSRKPDNKMAFKKKLASFPDIQTAAHEYGLN
jgi:hypothetical protein